MGVAARPAGGALVPPLQHRWLTSAPSTSVVLSDDDPMAAMPIAAGYISSEATGIPAHEGPNPTSTRPLLYSDDESMELLISSPSPDQNPNYSPDHLSDLELPPEEGEILPGGHVNAKSSYLVRVCMQRIYPNFFLMLRKK